MQEGIAPKNPLDVGIPSTIEVAAKWCETAANDPHVDMVAWASPMPRKTDAWGDVSALRAVLDTSDPTGLAASIDPSALLQNGIEPAATIRELGPWIAHAYAADTATSGTQGQIAQARGLSIRSVKRSASASPATGSAKAHELEQKTLISLAFTTTAAH